MENKPNDRSTDSTFSSHEERGAPKHDHRLSSFEETLTSQPPQCPECNTKLEQRSSRKCNYCGFHYGYLQKLLPRDLPVLDRITNFSDEISMNEEDQILNAMDHIQKKYPQIFIKVVVLPLQSGVEIQQMALWMLNECPILSDEKDEDRLWTILLFVNSATKKSCFAIGYKAEVFFQNSVSSKLILELDSSLRSQSVGIAIKPTMEDILLNLDYSKKMVKQQYKLFRSKSH